ncbi:MAG: hypothetical protein OEU32_19440, partial [Acidimicrobiia bacterium]|nr:hypothetical protein [Acidimicrobiia bacterium]
AIVAVAAALCAAALVPASSSAAGDPTGDRPDAPDDRVATAHTTGPEVLQSRIFVSNTISSGAADYDFLFGDPTDDQILTGDWTGNGTTGFATRSGNVFTLVDERGFSEGTAAYGSATDEIVIGDWDGNRSDTLGVRRANVFFVRNSPTTGVADAVFAFGQAGDELFVGDWNGDGIDTFAVRRGNQFHVRNSITTGVADIVFAYGKADDQTFVGDWNGDGIDTFAVRRGRDIFIRNDFETGVAHTTISFGFDSDQLLVGDWNADGTDTFALRRVALEPGPIPRIVNEQAWEPFATTGPVTLFHPASLVERIGFHESGHDGSQQMDALDVETQVMTMETRNRGTGSRSAADIVVEPETQIRAPVTGTVIAEGGYLLYCQYSDDYVYIEPDSRPGWQVKIFHIDGEQVSIGDRVIAGVTVLAPRATRFPFESQIDEFTAEPSWPHVHVEVVDPSIPDKTPPGGC